MISPNSEPGSNINFAALVSTIWLPIRQSTPKHWHLHWLHRVQLYFRDCYDIFDKDTKMEEEIDVTGELMGPEQREVQGQGAVESVLERYRWRHIGAHVFV